MLYVKHPQRDPRVPATRIPRAGVEGSNPLPREVEIGRAAVSAFRRGERRARAGRAQLVFAT